MSKRSVARWTLHSLRAADEGKCQDAWDMANYASEDLDDVINPPGRTKAQIKEDIRRSWEGPHRTTTTLKLIDAVHFALDKAKRCARRNLNGSVR